MLVELVVIMNAIYDLALWLSSWTNLRLPKENFEQSMCNLTVLYK